MTSSLRSRCDRRLVAGAITLAVVLLAGCGRGQDPLEIGFRRIALDLAFKDAELSAAGAQQVVQRVIGDVDVELPGVIRRVRVIPAPIEECPSAVPGATPQTPAFAVVKTPPGVGVYPRHNTGEIVVEAATQSFTIPVPPRSRWEIPAVRTIEAHRLVNENDPAVSAAPAAEPMQEFELTRRLTSAFVVTDTYRYTEGKTEGDFLYLVKRVTVADGETSEFVPSPPIRIVRLNVPEGNLAEAGVVHAGLDRATNVAMSVQSQILTREAVDVCGEVIDTYRVEIAETVVDLSKNPPEVSGNEPGTSSFWNIQFDNGLLIVREEVHTVRHTSTEIAGQAVPVTVRADYVSTVDSLVPEPFDAGSAP